MIAILKRKQIISPGYTLYILEGKEIAATAEPGQFLEVRVSKGSHPAMRKPLSVFCTEGDTFGLLVKTDGYGANLMKRWEPGEEVDIIGPLGRGFRFSRDDNDFILVAGGVGLSPLNFLSQELSKKGKNVHLIYAPKRSAVLLDAFSVKSGVNIHLSEHDVLFGIDTIADDMKKLISTVENPCGVYTCGPNEFMKLVSETASSCGLQTQVSLETRMSCGMGVCLGCVVAIRSGDDWEHKTVCHDGPVFLGEEVIFG